MKKCSICGDPKPLSEFHKDRQTKDGLRSYCKLCHNKQAREWERANREMVRAKQSEYRKSGKYAAWKKAHPDSSERKREYMRELYRMNPEKERERIRVKAAKHPEWSRSKKRNRRAQMLGSGGTITTREWRALKAFYNYTCLRCGKREPEINLTLDHVVPLVEGGSHKIENAQCLCLPCNSRKGRNHIDYRPLIYSPA